MANAKFIEAWCNKKVKDIKKAIVNDLSKDIEITARRNFARAVPLIPASDTFIDVWAIKNDDSFKIICGGTQVLFVEFGAGITHSTETSTVLTDSDNRQVEYASRPKGIVGIGGYGKHLGLNDKWYFSDVNLVAETGKNHTTMVKATSTGKFVYITEGIRPVRALYLAVNSGVKKLTTKKIRRIG